MELKEIRRKIGSVNNIRELTSALETLSALKMKKAQKIASQSRPFSQMAGRILAKLKPILEEEKNIFLKEKKIRNVLFAVLSSDRGFCGPFNQNILKLAEKEIEAKKREGVALEIFPVGKKGSSFFKRKGYQINFSFFGVGDFGGLEEIKPVSDFLVKAFLEDRFQKIYLVWTDFLSTFSQKPKIIQLLPFKTETLKEFFREEIKEEKIDYLVEPSLDMLAQEIIPQLIEYLIYQSVLESNASEHSARMMAMRNASDNAQKKLEKLKLDCNKARQEQITREVCEISSTKEVLE